MCGWLIYLKSGFCISKEEWRQRSEKFLFLFNYAHNNIAGHMGMLRLCFYRPNCTSILQPLGQGIIHAAKNILDRDSLEEC
jgi:hypothetical protein